MALSRFQQAGIRIKKRNFYERLPDRFEMVTKVPVGATPGRIIGYRRIGDASGPIYSYEAIEVIDDDGMAKCRFVKAVAPISGLEDSWTNPEEVH